MYTYEYDADTGGLLLKNTTMISSNEPRPVYYQELDLLGLDQYWSYDKNDFYPYMWVESNNYYYRGKKVAKTKGGSLFNKPEIIILDKPESEGTKLRFVDVPRMIQKNAQIMEGLTQDTIKKIYNTYIEHKNEIDVFYVAFSGGKDSVVALDLVQRALPHNEFKVLFGDTGMEFSDTYDLIDEIEYYCESKEIDFRIAKSKLSTDQTWKMFGPPAVTNRWCCSVHKTSPQIMLLQKITRNKEFTGMAFTGVRSDESLTRSTYQSVSEGGKHQGQYSCHPILEWNSAELFIYIYQNDLILNNAYKKGNSRVGCLMCPMSSGKHEYMKHVCYKDGVDDLIEKIKSTSGKNNYSDKELEQFVDGGFWKTRKSGRELNFGADKHYVDTSGTNIEITVFDLANRWKEWAKTVGEFYEISNGEYSISFRDKLYAIKVEEKRDGTHFSFPGCGKSKDDARFISLIRSVIIKSIYCVNCGVCVAECKNGCIKMDGPLVITDECQHCHKCHDIHEHCLRYNSIRNKIGGNSTVKKGLGRFFGFGVREVWMRTFFKYEGKEEFWDSDGDKLVANKRKDAFLSFLKDAEVVHINKNIGHDKYTKNELTEFGKIMLKLGIDSESMWAMLVCNLVYAPDFNWYVKNIPFQESITPDSMKLKLEEVMENDTKGLGKRNVVDTFKIIFTKTPIGQELGLGVCDYSEKVTASGKENITLNSLIRTSWNNPDPLVILYSLYRFAEACGDYHQFTLTRLLNHEIDSDGVSPTEIFGLERDQMEKILNGLSINYPEYINASFTLDLDNITLRKDKTSKDVLELF